MITRGYWEFSQNQYDISEIGPSIYTNKKTVSSEIVLCNDHQQSTGSNIWTSRCAFIGFRIWAWSTISGVFKNVEFPTQNNCNKKGVVWWLTMMGVLNVSSLPVSSLDTTKMCQTLLITIYIYIYVFIYIHTYIYIFL